MLDCGHPAVPKGCGNGVVWDKDKSMCYACAAEQISARMDTGEPTTAYVSSAGDLTTWDGQVLAHGNGFSTTTQYTPTGGEWTCHYWQFIRKCALWYGVNGGHGRVITVRKLKG